MREEGYRRALSSLTVRRPVVASPPAPPTAAWCKTRNRSRSCAGARVAELWVALVLVVPVLTCRERGHRNRLSNGAPSDLFVFNLAAPYSVASSWSAARGTLGLEPLSQAWPHNPTTSKLVPAFTRVDPQSGLMPGLMPGRKIGTGPVNRPGPRHLVRDWSLPRQFAGEDPTREAAESTMSRQLRPRLEEADTVGTSICPHRRPWHGLDREPSPRLTQLLCPKIEHELWQESGDASRMGPGQFGLHPGDGVQYGRKSPIAFRFAMQAKERGATLIHVDPRRPLLVRESADAAIGAIRTRRH